MGNNVKNEWIRFRCTSRQKEIIESKAKKANMSLSEYSLQSALKTRTRISSVSKDMVRTITQCQTNLNMLSIKIQQLPKSKEIVDTTKLMDEMQGGLEELWRLLK